MSVSMKTCTKCGEQKTATPEFFSTHPGCRQGLEGRCRACANKYARDFRAQNLDVIKARKRADHRKYRDERCATQRLRIERAKQITPALARARTMVHAIRVTGRKKGVPVDRAALSVEVLVNWFETQLTCACCGVQFELFPKNGRWSGNSPSIDRFRPELGYVPDNVSLICWRCNNIKRNYLARDLRMVAEWMDRFEAGKFDPVVTLNAEAA